MTITARFSSVCPNCRQQIAIGDKVEWSRGRAARHISCQAAPVVQLSEDDAEFGREDPRSPHYRKSCRQPETCPLHGYNGRRPTGRPLILVDADDRSYDAWLENISNQCNDDAAWCQPCQDRHDLPVCGPNADFDYARGAYVYESSLDNARVRHIAGRRDDELDSWLVRKGWGK